MQYDREEYANAVKSELKKNIYYHSLAVEACMSGLYGYLEEHGQLSDNKLSKDEWALAGLLHDIDYSDKYPSEEHPNNVADVLRRYGLEISDEINRVIKAHAPDHTDIQPKSMAEWSIFCADSLTGLIVAVTLVYPSKKINDVKLSSVLKKFHKSPNFAAGTRRDEIAMCENADGLNMKLDTFVEVCLNAMKDIAGTIGL